MPQLAVDQPRGRLLLLNAFTAVLLLCFVLYTTSSPGVGRGTGSAALHCHSASAKEQDGRQRIPKILHRVFFSGREEFEKLRNNPQSSIRAEWDTWCQLLHRRAGWQYRFWNASDVEALLDRHYPWFRPTWERYDKRINRADAIRYFIMHRYGGLYLDMDVECYREAYDMLEGADVVLQGSHISEGTTNAALASVPGHPLWPALFKALERRAGEKHPIDATGPRAVSEALVKLGALTLPPGKWETWRRNPYDGTHDWNGTTIKVYPTGQWYTPCWFTDKGCIEREAKMAAAGLKKPDVCGYHHFTGTWNQQPDSGDAARWDNGPPVR